MHEYKWGILAPGNISHKFVQGLSVVPGAVKYAVGSRDKNRAETFASQYGFKKAYGSYQELVNDPDVDIIYIATPHPQHEDAAILCMNNKKAVLCEKPVSVNAQQTERMIKCARENNVFFMEAMWTRFLPTVCKARELIANNEIGNIRLINASFGFRSEINPEGRLFSLSAGGGSLLDVGIYNLSFCSMLYGKQPDRIQSDMTIGSTGVDEETSLLLGYEGGKKAQLTSAIRLGMPQDAVILGENGRIELPDYWHGNILKLYNENGMKEFSLPFEATGYQFEAIEVMQCLSEGHTESKIMPLDESLAVMQTSDRIRKDNDLVYPCD